MEELIGFVKKHIYLTLSVAIVGVICAVLVMSFYADREMQRRGRLEFFEQVSQMADSYLRGGEFDRQFLLGLSKNMKGDSFAVRCRKIEELGTHLSVPVDGYYGLGVADRDGNVYTSSGLSYNFRERNFFQRLRNGEELLSTDSNNYTSDGNNPVLYTMASLKDSKDEFDGAVFIISNALEGLKLVDSSFYGKELPLVLVKPNGQVLQQKGKQFVVSNLLNFFREYSPDCAQMAETMQGDFAKGASGMLTSDYLGGCTVAYYPVHSFGDLQSDYLVAVFSDEALYTGINDSMSRLNKYLAFGVLVIVLLMGYILYIYLQMNAKIENLSYVSDVTGGPNLRALQKTLAEEEWTDFHIVVMGLNGYYETVRYQNLNQIRNLMARLWHNMSHEFEGPDMRLAFVHSNYFVLAVRRDRDGTEQLLAEITQSITKFCQVNSVSVLNPYFGVLHRDSLGDDFLGDLGHIVGIISGYDFEQCNTNFVFCDDEQDVLKVKDGRLVEYFEEAVNSHAFQIMFQPKHDKEGKLTGAKLVSNWKLNDGRVLKAAEFIGPLTRHGLLSRVDMLNFRMVCGQLREWQAAGKKLVPISVYLSDGSLFQENLAREYKLMTEVAGIPTSLIQLEITEASLTHVGNIQDVLKEFHNMGFSLTVGDFANGISGLARITDMPIDRLSLGHIVDGMDSPSGTVIFRSLVKMAKELGLKICLCHISTQERLEKVREFDFDEMAGACIAKEMLPQEFVKLLQ